jgi:hypothetical protein
MEDKSRDSVEASPEQLRYAGVLEKGMYFGLVLLLVTFAIYVFGIMDSYLPLEDLPVHWTKSVHEYLEDAQIEPGWAWISLLRYGDFLNFIGIALLAGVSVLCYAVIIPILLKKKDTIYTILVILEILVLLVAASGILPSGH